MNKLNRASLLIVLLIKFSTVLAQDATSTVGFGYNFIKKKPTIDLQFNRTTAADAEDQYDIYLIKRSFVLQPSSEIHLGSGTETSEDNIILHLNTFFKNAVNNSTSKKMWTTAYKINVLSPQVSADKNFKIYQIFGTVGGDLITYYSRRDKLGYLEFGLGVDFDYGLSSVDTAKKKEESVSRIKIRPSTQYQFWGKRSNDTIPQELDDEFYYRADISAKYIFYNFFQQDTRVVSEKSIGYFKASLGYRFVKHLKLSIDYKTGMLEPNFKKVNAFSLSLSLVN